jgi:hypothetical protein
VARGSSRNFRRRTPTARHERCAGITNGEGSGLDEYQLRRDELVEADRRKHGDRSMLETNLATARQIRTPPAHGKAALKNAGLEARGAATSRRGCRSSTHSTSTSRPPPRSSAATATSGRQRAAPVHEGKQLLTRDDHGRKIVGVGASSSASLHRKGRAASRTPGACSPGSTTHTASSACFGSSSSTDTTDDEGSNALVAASCH